MDRLNKTMGNRHSMLVQTRQERAQVVDSYQEHQVAVIKCKGPHVKDYDGDRLRHR